MLSVIIPTYNEGPNVRGLLDRLAAVRDRFAEPMEVLIVDDGSPDGTAAVAARQLETTHLGRVISRRGARDLAAAVAEGVRHARGELIGVMDADLSHPPELLPQLVRAVREGCDLAIASRYVPGGGTDGWPPHRRWLSRTANALARPLAGVRDATSGFFVCQAAVLQGLGERLSGFKILLEVLASGRAPRVREVPYVFVDRRRGASKLGARPIGAYLAQLTRLYAQRCRP